MTLRVLLNKEDTCFLVQYDVDKKHQIRTSGFFRTSEKIIVGQSYDVQWGRAKKNVDKANVVASGKETDMKALMEQRTAPASTPTAAPATQPKPKPATKRSKPPAKNDQSKKAKVLMVASPPRESTEHETARAPTPEGQVITPPDQTAAAELPPVVIVGSPPRATRLITQPDQTAAAERPPVGSPPRESTADETERAPTPEPLTARAICQNVAAQPPLDMSGEFPLPDFPPPDFPEDDIAVAALDDTTTDAPVVAPATAPPAKTPSTFELSRRSVTPFRTVRPTNAPSPGGSGQVNAILNVICESLKDINKSNQEMHRVLVTFNKRLTDVEVASERMERKLDSALCQLTQQQVPEVTDNSIGEVPEHDAVSPSTLAALKQEANNAQHFACLLLPHIFPELFGVDNLRLLYNWSGNVAGKQALDHTRKLLIQKYSNFYYPETRSTTGWTTVVTRINERLRRKEVRAKVNGRNAATSENVLQNIENLQTNTAFGDAFSLLQYINTSD